jgi:hypothetical protein
MGLSAKKESLNKGSQRWTQHRTIKIHHGEYTHYTLAALESLMACAVNCKRDSGVSWHIPFRRLVCTAVQIR